MQTSIVNGEALALYEAGGHVSFPSATGEPGSSTSASTRSTTPSQIGGRQWTDADDRQLGASRLAGPERGRLHRRLRLRRDRVLAAAQQRERRAPDQARQPLHWASPTPGPACCRTIRPHYYPFEQSARFARLVPSDAQEATRDGRLHALARRAPALSGSRTTPTRCDAEIVPLRSRAARLGAGSRSSAHASLAARRADGTPPSAFAGDRARRSRRAAPTPCSSAARRADGARRSGASSTPRCRGRSCSPRARSRCPRSSTALGAAASATYVTSPYLEPDQYPAARAGRVRAPTARDFGIAPTVYTLYGYEAMRDRARGDPQGRAPAPRTAPTLRNAFFGLGDDPRRDRRPTASTPTATRRSTASTATASAPAAGSCSCARSAERRRERRVELGSSAKRWPSASARAGTAFWLAVTISAIAP